MERNQEAYMAGQQHDLDYGEIDELDEISGDEQFVLIWCETHQEYEWHWVLRRDI